MGNKTSSYRFVNFEDIQNYIHNQNVNIILISTLPDNSYDLIIPKTIHYKDEIDIMNNMLKENTHCPIYIYGKNTNDYTIYQKYEQLLQLGFTNVYLYCGGLFEWLCLQDIYGNDEFPLSKKENDILKYKPHSDFIHSYSTSIKY